MIVLFNPLSTTPGKQPLPLSVMSLAAVLEKSWPWTLVDGNVCTDPAGEIVARLARASSSDVSALAVTVMPGPQLTQAVAVCRAVRAALPQVPIVWGGYFPTQHANTVLGSAFVDFVVRSQGERPLLQLVETLRGGGPRDIVGGLSWKSPAGRLGPSSRPSDKGRGSKKLEHPAPFSLLATHDGQGRLCTCGRQLNDSRICAQAIAAKMGLAATIQKTDSPQIVGALLAKKGDAIISALQITPDLERQVALVAYFRAGQAILVRKGNPSGIGGLTDLCGKNVSVQVQSPEENTVDEANGGVCKGNAIKKHVYPTDLQAVLILKQRGVDAALDDSPVAAYFVKQTPDQLELAGGPFKTNPEGIAIDPKNGDVLKAVQQAMLAIYQDGSYRQILTKWNLLDGEIPVSQIVVSPSPTTS